MNASEGFGVPPPPAPPPARWSIVYPKPGLPIDCVMVSDAWLGCECHWWQPPGGEEARTVLCGKPDKCVCLHETVPDKWVCYAGVMLFKSRARAVITLSRNGLHSLLDLAGNRETLRGLPVTFSRLNAHANSPARACYLARDWPGPLPPNFDLAPTLQAVYGKDEVDAYLAKLGRKDGVV